MNISSIGMPSIRMAATVTTKPTCSTEELKIGSSSAPVIASSVKAADLSMTSTTATAHVHKPSAPSTALLSTASTASLHQQQKQAAARKRRRNRAIEIRRKKKLRYLQTPSENVADGRRHHHRQQQQGVPPVTHASNSHNNGSSSHKRPWTATSNNHHENNSHHLGVSQHHHESATALKGCLSQNSVTNASNLLFKRGKTDVVNKATPTTTTTESSPPGVTKTSISSTSLVSSCSSSDSSNSISTTTSWSPESYRSSSINHSNHQTGGKRKKMNKGNSNGLIPPTVAGIHDVTQRWQKGQAVGLPTECTYEAVQLYRYENDDDGIGQQTSQEHSKLTGRDDCPKPADSSNSFSLSSSPKVHVYCSKASLASQPSSKSSSLLSVQSGSRRFLQQILPRKPYAMHPSVATRLASESSKGDGDNESHRSIKEERQPPSSPSTKVPLPVYVFSEGRVVASRLAAAVWPGPTRIYVSTTCAKVLGNSNGRQKIMRDAVGAHKHGDDQYVCLRCPSHPLAVKALQQQLSTNQDRDSTMGISQLLVGWDLAGTRASQIVTNEEKTANTTKVSAVLDGEDRRELFCVPPCQQDSHASLWMNLAERTVYVRRRGNPLSSSRSSTTAFTTDQVAGWLRRRVNRRRRSSTMMSNTTCCSGASVNSGTPMNKSSTVKQLLVEAVVRQWKVVEVEPSDE